MDDVVGERGVLDWMTMPLKRYAEFSGRSRRKEYWWFTLLAILVAAVFLAVLISAGLSLSDTEGTMNGVVLVIVLIGLLLYLAILIPSIAVQVRRFHDQDRSGWLVLLNFVPYVGGLIVFIFMLLEGTKGPNKFGPDPKGRSAVDPSIFA